MVVSVVVVDKIRSAMEALEAVQTRERVLADSAEESVLQASAAKRAAEVQSAEDRGLRAAADKRQESINMVASAAMGFRAPAVGERQAIRSAARVEWALEWKAANRRS